MNQTTKGSSNSSNASGSFVTVTMNDGSKQVINVSTIPTDERTPLHGTVNGKPVQSATVCRPKGSRDIILSTTRNPHQGIAITLSEAIAISQNAGKLNKLFGGTSWGDQTSS